MTTKKIAAVSMVKDECDIIELFVRVNSRVVDRFFILDNNSSDSTRNILASLIEEGFPITLFMDDSLAYPQDVITTKLIREAAADGEFDWIMPLDADEFIQADKAGLLAELARLPEGHCGLLNWATFIPLSDKYFSYTNPLWSNFRQCSKEAYQQSKVIVPAALAQSGVLTMGNHKFLVENAKYCPSALLNTKLAHVPIRSSDQLVSKVIVGSHQYSIKKNRKAETGFHWDVIAGLARKNNYKLDYSTLRKTAFSYVAKQRDHVVDSVSQDTRLGAETDCIVYRDLVSVNLQQRFDAFMQSLCEEIRSKW